MLFFIHGLDLDLNNARRSIVNCFGLVLMSEYYVHTSEPRSLRDLYNKKRDKMVANEVLYIAILLRVLDDRMKNKLLSQWNGSINIIGHEDGAKEGLGSLRIACNKIIHAERAGWHLSSRGVDFEPYDLGALFLDPLGKTAMLDLSGTEADKKWSAKLNVVTFLEHASQAIAYAAEQEEQYVKIISGKVSPSESSGVPESSPE